MFSFSKNKSVTFTELLIAIILLSAMLLAVTNITIFSREQLVSIQRRTKLQNDVSLILDHITKNGSLTVGNYGVIGAPVVFWGSISSLSYLYFFIDYNGNSMTDFTGSSFSPLDHWVGYNFYPADNTLVYNSNCGSEKDSTTCPPADDEIIGRKIISFSASGDWHNLTGNYVAVNILACWNPAGDLVTREPCVNMSTSIGLPLVSIN